MSFLVDYSLYVHQTGVDAFTRPIYHGIYISVQGIAISRWIRSKYSPQRPKKSVQLTEYLGSCAEIAALDNTLETVVYLEHGAVSIGGL